MISTNAKRAPERIIDAKESYRMARTTRGSDLLTTNKWHSGHSSPKFTKKTTLTAVATARVK